MLDEVMGKGKFKNYPLLDIESAISKDNNVVLVEITNLNDDNEEEKLYRWFEVPKEWTREEFLKRLGEI